jgi:hypothetical protein
MNLGLQVDSILSCLPHVCYTPHSPHSPFELVDITITQMLNKILVNVQVLLASKNPRVRHQADVKLYSECPLCFYTPGGGGLGWSNVAPSCNINIPKGNMVASSVTYIHYVSRGCLSIYDCSLRTK